MVRALNVAEKPSVARELSSILSRGRSNRRNGLSQYNHIFDFECQVMGQQVQMSVTSVTGHLMETEFVKPYGRNWSSCQPVELFHIPIEKHVREDLKPLERQLKQEARTAQWLVLWLDCDREGENIAYEVVHVCKEANPRLRIYRAKFSALIPREIWRSVDSLQEPDEHASRAVDARQEIDLRLGSAFTRFQTQRLQQRFEQLSDGVISYGPCQFPTLGFVIERHKRIENFVRESFWYIVLEYEAQDVTAEKGVAKATFSWARERLYDHLACLIIYEMCLEEPCVARVTTVDARDTTKWRPIPLATVELQKRASRFLRMAAEHTMKVAEDLYQKGYISYPRTETEKFSKNFEIQPILQDHLNHSQWGGYVDKLVNHGAFQWPREGKNDDKAHPPIHPTKCVDPQSLNTDDERRLYELVCKHFFAVCSKDAKGHQTKVTVELGGELFNATGLMVFEKNWLEIYSPWERWSAKNIPLFQVGQTFTPSSVRMKDGRTEPPQHLSESELIAEMDKNGIGTDATIAQHIKTIQDRKYAEKNHQARFVPTILGIALYDGYNDIGYALTKPSLRAQMERDCNDIARGLKTKEAVIDFCLKEMKKVFQACSQNAQKLDEAIAQHFDAIGTGSATKVKKRNFSKCGICQGKMDLKESSGQRKGLLVYCQHCTRGFPLPHKGKPVAHDHICPLCNFQVLSITNGNGYTGKGYTVCPHCFTNAPEMSADTGAGFRCFQCSADCPLAGRVAGQDTKLFACRKCGSDMVGGKLEKNGRVTFRIGCKGYPGCKCTVWLPNAVTLMEPTQDQCQACTRGQNLVLKVKLKFSRTKIPPEMNHEMVACPLCSQNLKAIGINFVGFSPNEMPQGTGSQRIVNNRPNITHRSTAFPAPENRRNLRNNPSLQRTNSTDAGSSSSFNQNNTQSRSQRNTGTSNGSFGDSRGASCYKCGEPGHFSTNCPQKSTGSGTARATPSNITCYKCGEPGHFSSSCPQNNDSHGGNAAGGNDRNCFNCGNPGHFSSNCPQNSGSLGHGEGSVRTAGQGGGSCYKCGEHGHFSSSCPQNSHGTGFQKASSLYTEQKRSNSGYNNRNSGSTALEEDCPRCPGHDLPCSLRTTTKEGQNKGRRFYVCSLPQSEQCKFFKWESEVASTSSRLGYTVNTDRNQGMRNQNRNRLGGIGNMICSHCHQSGHGSRECPTKYNR